MMPKQATFHQHGDTRVTDGNLKQEAASRVRLTCWPPQLTEKALYGGQLASRVSSQRVATSGSTATGILQSISNDRHTSNPRRHCSNHTKMKSTTSDKSTLFELRGGNGNHSQHRSGFQMLLSQVKKFDSKTYANNYKDTLATRKTGAHDQTCRAAKASA